MKTKEQIKDFEELSKPLIKWLNDNCNPHARIIVDVTGAELVYGECNFYTQEYIKD